METRDQTTSPDVTVLIVAHNKAEQIQACLHAVMWQDYPMERVEVLLVDDRSTDGTAARAREMDLKCLRVLRIDETPEKLTARQAAVDAGIGAARGAVVLVTDADARAPREWIRELSGHLGFRDGASCGPIIYSGRGRPLARLQTLHHLIHLTMDRWMNRHGRASGLVGQNMAIRREAYLETGGFPVIGFAPNDDAALGAALHRIGWSLRYLTQPPVQVPAGIGIGELMIWARRRITGALGLVQWGTILLVVTNMLLAAAAIRWRGLWLAALAARYLFGMGLIAVWVSQYGRFRLRRWICLYEPVMTLINMLTYLMWLTVPRWRWSGVTYGRGGPHRDADEAATPST